MERWLRVLSVVHHYAYLLFGCCGLFVTLWLAAPGSHVLVVGPVRFDGFYATLAAFASLILLSLTDEYDPGDYGREA